MDWSWWIHPLVDMPQQVAWAIGYITGIWTGVVFGVRYAR